MEIAEAMKEATFNNTEIAEGIRWGGLNNTEIAAAMKEAAFNNTEIVAGMKRAGFNNIEIAAGLKEAAFNNTEIIAGMKRAGFHLPRHLYHHSTLFFSLFFVIIFVSSLRCGPRIRLTAFHSLIFSPSTHITEHHNSAHMLFILKKKLQVLLQRR